MPHDCDEVAQELADLKNKERQEILARSRPCPIGLVELAQEGYTLTQNIYVKLQDAVNTHAIAIAGSFPSKEWEEAQAYQVELLRKLAEIQGKAQENERQRNQQASV